MTAQTQPRTDHQRLRSAPGRQLVAYRDGLRGALPFKDGGPVLIGGHGAQRATVMRHVTHGINLQGLG